MCSSATPGGECRWPVMATVCLCASQSIPGHASKSALPDCVGLLQPVKSQPFWRAPEIGMPWVTRNKIFGLLWRPTSSPGLHLLDVVSENHNTQTPNPRTHDKTPPPRTCDVPPTFKPERLKRCQHPEPRPSQLKARLKRKRGTELTWNCTITRGDPAAFNLGGFHKNNSDNAQATQTSPVLFYWKNAQDHRKSTENTLGPRLLPQAPRRQRAIVVTLCCCSWFAPLLG